MVGRVIDSLIVFRFLKMLVTPFDKTPAFKFGFIDKNGTRLKNIPDPENKNRLLKNIVSSSYSDHEENFRRQVYISKVGVYDEQKNLIGIATLADPVLKDENEDYVFKLKLDI